MTWTIGQRVYWHDPDMVCSTEAVVTEIGLPDDSAGHGPVPTVVLRTDDGDIVYARDSEVEPETLIEPRILHFGDGTTAPNLHIGSYHPGQTVKRSVAAPGIGQHVYRVTRIDTAGVWALYVGGWAREMTPGEAR